MTIFRFICVMALLVLYALAGAAYEQIRQSRSNWLSYNRQTQKVNGIEVTGHELFQLRASSPGMGPSSLAFNQPALHPTALATADNSRSAQIPPR
jgi:hypothetical protein